jgi:hypothetical protein
LNNAYQEILLQTDIKEFDVLYGDLLIQGSELKYISRPLNTIFHEIPIFHPAVFIKSDIFKQFAFNINYKIAGDYDLILRLYLSNKRFKYVPIYISAFNLKGVSNTNFKRAIFETGKSIFLNSPYPSKFGNLWTYIQGKIRFIIFNIIYNTIGIGNYSKVKVLLRKAHI